MSSLSSTDSPKSISSGLLLKHSSLRLHWYQRIFKCSKVPLHRATLLLLMCCSPDQLLPGPVPGMEPCTFTSTTHRSPARGVTGVVCTAQCGDGEGRACAALPTPCVSPVSSRGHSGAGCAFLGTLGGRSLSDLR